MQWLQHVWMRSSARRLVSKGTERTLVAYVWRTRQQRAARSRFRFCSLVPRSRVACKSSVIDTAEGRRVVEMQILRSEDGMLIAGPSVTAEKG